MAISSEEAQILMACSHLMIVDNAAKDSKRNKKERERGGKIKDCTGMKFCEYLRGFGRQSRVLSERHCCNVLRPSRLRD